MSFKYIVKNKILLVLMLSMIIVLQLVSCKNEEGSRPITLTGYSTICNNNNNVSDIQDSKEIIYSFIYRLINNKDHTISIDCTTKALFGMYKQHSTEYHDVSNNIVKCDIASDGFLSFKHGYTYDYNSSIFSYYHKDNKYNNVLIDDYKNVYGLTSMDALLFGYVITEDTIMSIEKIDNSNDEFTTIKLMLDTSASVYQKKQMKEFGNLKEEPSFDLIEMTLKLSNDFSIVDISICSKYTINIDILGTLKCTQSIDASYKERR